MSVETEQLIEKYRRYDGPHQPVMWWDIQAMAKDLAELTAQVAQLTARRKTSDELTLS